MDLQVVEKWDQLLCGLDERGREADELGATRLFCSHEHIQHTHPQTRGQRSILHKQQTSLKNTVVVVVVSINDRRELVIVQVDSQCIQG